MSDIQPGDLCVVVRDCCGHWLGAMLSVEKILSDRYVYCEKCNYIVPGTMPVVESAMGGRMFRAPLSWLKKIPPLTEDESAEREAETVT